LMVEEMVIVEVKAVEAIAPVHKKQLLTYLKRPANDWGC
jgi:GxxExxY protein